MSERNRGANLTSEEPTIQENPITRRSFLKKAAIGLGAAGFLMNYPWLKETLETEINPESTMEELESTIEELETAYGFKLDLAGADIRYEVKPRTVETATETIPLPSGTLHYTGEKATSLAQLRDGIHLLKQEMEKFPPELIQKLQLKKIYLVTDLAAVDENGNRDHMDGAYIQEEKIILLSIDGASVFSPHHIYSWIKKPVLYGASHETYHALDEHFNEFVRNDNAYRNVVYANQLKHAPLIWQYFKDPSRPQGESSAYSFAGTANEKQPEDVRLLMESPEYAHTQALGDPLLEKKFEFVRNELFRWSNGRMDDQYWKDLRAGRVNMEYWRKH